MTLIHNQQEIILVKPKITLFAFQLRKELTQEAPTDAEEIWSNLSEVGKLLKIEELQELPTLIAKNAPLLNNQTTLARNEEIQELLPKEPVIKLDYPATSELPGFTGGIYPVRLHDTYCVDLTLRYQEDNFSLDTLSKINPDGCLSSKYIKASLGQTLLFFSLLADYKQNTETNARAIVASLIAHNERNDAERFFLRGEGVLLGGKIYEFTENLSNPLENNHLLVWLANDVQTIDEEAGGDYYQPLVDLLCSQKKIQFAYYQARQRYKEGEQYYQRIEPIVQQFSQWETEKDRQLQQELNDLIEKTRNRKRKRLLQGLSDDSAMTISNKTTAYLDQYNDRRLEARLQKLSQQQLEQLEQWLVQIPENSVNFTLCLRDIKTQLTTIVLNSQNYQTSLQRLQNLNPDGDDLVFWSKFLTADSHRFQQQISYDLEYLLPGKELFEPTIGSMRGLVEISAQKQQIAAEKKEKERERSIGVWVTVVGSGLAVSGISSSVMSQQPAELLFDYSQLKNYQQHWYGNPFSLLFLNLLFHSVIGILSAILVGIFARGVIAKFMGWIGNVTKGDN
ncbi:MAG: hypothetical protein QNJ70_23695 [Xenococcaceae cyanobacterium MO_207.B15]|nr:hypothetical protein [Xenococcaceae cyanobacterium MO_207.B15]